MTHRYKTLSPVMKRCIQHILGLSCMHKLANDDFLKVKSLIIKDSITNLTGLHKCRNLTSLRMQNGYACDLTPLENLPLEHIDLYSNCIGDIAPLKDMTTLQYLNISNNSINNYLPLCSLKNLVHLYADIPFHQSYIIKALPNLKTFNGKPIISKRYTWLDDEFVVNLVGADISIMAIFGGVEVKTHTRHDSNTVLLSIVPKLSIIKNISIKDAITIVEEMLMTEGLFKTKQVIQKEFITSCPEYFNLGVDENLLGTELVEEEDKDDMFRGL